MNVLVPLDGSSLAEGILRHIPPLLMARKAKLLLLQVLPRGSSEQDEAAALRYLADATKEVAASGEEPEAILRIGDPADQILSVADDYKADQIVMATHGRSGVARIIRGSVAERVLRNATVPVYLASPKGLSGKSNESFSRVLIPLDGSKLAASIMPLVLPMVSDSQAEVVLLHVSVPGKESVHPVPEVAKKRAQAKAETALADVQDSLKAAGVTAHVFGTYGDPAEELLAAIERQEADLLAMTSHGREGLSRWRFGSVAEKVLREARCPLLIKTAPRR
jgi:nucleotide-binding universal stress UspA family protein